MNFKVSFVFISVMGIDEQNSRKVGSVKYNIFIYTCQPKLRLMKNLEIDVVLFPARLLCFNYNRNSRKIFSISNSYSSGFDRPCFQ